MKKSYVLAISLFLLLNHTWSQDCGCDHFISLDLSEVDGSDYAPGDVVCIDSGTRLQLQFENVEGTAENPVIIQNCGGEVVINAPYSPYGIEFLNSKHVQLSGNGDADIAYGITVVNTQNYGVGFLGLSNKFQIDHVKIEEVSGPAILAYNEPTCDLSANEGVFYMEDCELSNLNILGCKSGIQIGHPNFGDGLVHPDCGALFPHSVKNLAITNVRIAGTTGGHGISLFGAQGRIENCTLTDIFGIGILMGTESAMRIEKSEIRDTYQYGIRAEGSGQHVMRNNVFVNNSGVGQGAVWLDFFSALGGIDYNSIEFVHNTSVNSGSYNLTIANPDGATAMCYIQNNIFAESAVLEPYAGDYGAYLNITESELFTVNHNAYEADLIDFNFVDAAENNFQLTHSSPVINDGIETEIEWDKNNQPRDLAGAPDLGAYEYVPEPIAYFEEIPLVGLYIDDFKNIIGDDIKETELLDFAVDNGFNYLLLYNLSYIDDHIISIDDPVESVLLADFIERAKKEYGMVQVGAVGETNASFDKIEAFNGFQGDDWFRKFDVLNMEFEFWTDTDALLDYYCENYLDDAGLPCTNAAAYVYYEGQLEDIDERADEMGIISEIYIGYTTDPQSISLAERCDRMLLHHYRTTDVYGDGTSIYNYHTYRIRAIALSERMPAVMPIFSSRSYHMGPWLLDHSLHQPFETWMFGVEGYLEDDSEGVADLPIAGFQWYRYTSFLDLELPDFFAPEEMSSELENGVEIQPNQLGATVSIDTNLPDENYSCEVYDLNGKQVHQQWMQPGTNRFELTNLSPGIYICVVSNQQDKLKTKKLMIH